MSHGLFRLTSSLMNTPLLITADAALGTLAYLQDRNMVEYAKLAMSDKESQKRPVDNFSDRPDTKTIGIFGSLAHRASGLDALCGAQSYMTLRAKFDDALNDPKINTIVLEIDSGGGEASGCFDLARHISDNSARNGGKRVIAYVAEHAYSAAYALASAADEIVIADTGGAGSIGVITVHQDISEHLSKEGIKITPIHAGKYKAIGNGYEALSDEARSMIQARVDKLYDKFVNLVAEHRGISTQLVRDTEAQTFSAEDALEKCLVDKIMSRDEFSQYLDSLANGSTEKSEKMDSSENPLEMTQKASAEELTTSKQESEMTTETMNLEQAMARIAQLEADKETSLRADAIAQAATKMSAFAKFGMDVEAYATALQDNDSATAFKMAEDALNQAVKMNTELDEKLTAAAAEKATALEQKEQEHKAAMQESDAMTELGSELDSDKAEEQEDGLDKAIAQLYPTK